MSDITMEAWQLSYIGMRAESRRRQLGMDIQQAAAGIGIKPGRLRAWEKKVPRAALSEYGRTWEEVLQAPPGWLTDDTIKIPEAPVLRQTAIDLGVCSTVTEEIVAIANWVAQHTNFEHEQRNAVLFAEHYGVAGRDKSTYSSIGERASISADRVRQIVWHMHRTLHHRVVEIDAPSMRSILRMAGPAWPPASTVLADLDRKWRSVLGPHLSVRSIVDFANDILRSEKNVACDDDFRLHCRQGGAAT